MTDPTWRSLAPDPVFSICRASEPSKCVECRYPTGTGLVGMRNGEPLCDACLISLDPELGEPLRLLGAVRALGDIARRYRPVTDPRVLDFVNGIELNDRPADISEIWNSWVGRDLTPEWLRPAHPDCQEESFYNDALDLGQLIRESPSDATTDYLTNMRWIREQLKALQKTHPHADRSACKQAIREASLRDSGLLTDQRPKGAYPSSATAG